MSDILAIGCRTHPVAVMRLGFWPPQLGHPGYDSGQGGECAGQGAAALARIPAMCYADEAPVKSPLAL
jgi:hypothetical protein